MVGVPALPAHGRGAGLGQVAFRAVLADLLADLIAAQALDHGRSDDERDQQSGQGPQNASQGQILKDVESFINIIGQPFG